MNLLNLMRNLLNLLSPVDIHSCRWLHDALGPPLKDKPLSYAPSYVSGLV